MIDFVWEPFVRLFREGGWVLYPIFAVSCCALYIVIDKLLQLRQLRSLHSHVFPLLASGANITDVDDNMYLTLQRKLIASSGRTAFMQRSCNEFISELKPQLDRGISTLSACVVIAPLLGLLGTIMGMNDMFNVIACVGFGNPSIMAGGISMALQATLTGLAVAVTILFFQDHILNTKTKINSVIASDLAQLISIKNAISPDPEKAKEHPMHADYRLLPEENEKPEINLAPFVDTIMILLIFFVVTANLYVETGVEVSKPKARSAVAAGQKAVLVGITRDGSVHVFGRQVSLERLKAIVQQEAAKQPEMSVVIVADKEAYTGRTVEVMDQCALAGAAKISIAAGRE